MSLFDTLASRLPIRLHARAEGDPNDDRTERHLDAMHGRRNMTIAVLVVLALAIVAAVGGAGAIAVLLLVGLIPMTVILAVLHGVVRATR